MFGIGGSELLVILIIALVVVGPKQLPELARTVGKIFGEFQKATDDLKREIDVSAQMNDKTTFPSDTGSAPAENTPAAAQNRGAEEPEALPEGGPEKKAE
jgi:Tat protein translocase TatB subunit